MSICIAGMHRSGTSMVAGLLRTMGVYLGEEADFLAAKEGDNAEGFWEHFGFYALNEQLLLQLHAGWDAPWVADGWEQREDLEPFRAQARLLADRMSGLAGPEGHWGWKDPRNSITIQFWRSLLPDTRVVICVRNPAEVMASLRKRNNLSVAASSRLWLRYYENLLSQVPRSHRVVTHYENYFENFEQEMGRVCAAVGLDVSAEAMARARAGAKPDLRHNRATRMELEGGDFPPELIRMVEALREESQSRTTGGAATMSSSIAPELKTAQPAIHGDTSDFARSRFNAETAQREEHLRRLMHENRMLIGKLADLELRLNEVLEEIDSAEREEADRLQMVSAMVDKAIEANSLVASRYVQLVATNHEAGKSLKGNKSALPWIGNFKWVRMLFDPLKRLRNMGRLLLLQADLNEAMAQNLSALTRLTVQMARGGNQMDMLPPGLDLAGSHQTPVDFSKLATLLRQRLL